MGYDTIYALKRSLRGYCFVGRKRKSESPAGRLFQTHDQSFSVERVGVTRLGIHAGGCAELIVGDRKWAWEKQRMQDICFILRMGR